jgi:hypothetical protein
MPDLRRDFNLSIGLALGYPARIEVRCDRTVEIQKVGVFRVGRETVI